MANKTTYETLKNTDSAVLMSACLSRRELITDSYFRVHGGVGWDGTNYFVMIEYITR